MFFACTQTTAGTGVSVWMRHADAYFLARPLGGTSAAAVVVVPFASVILMTLRKRITKSILAVRLAMRSYPISDCDGQSKPWASASSAPALRCQSSIVRAR